MTCDVKAYYLMQILETDHAVLTAYEVLKIINARNKDARPYKDTRDRQYLSEYNRISQARMMMIPTLLAHSPDGTKEDEEDDVGSRIKDFCNEIQALNPQITPFQIRNLISVRPRNIFEMACLFPTEEEWGMISDQLDSIIELVNKHFPEQKINE